MPLSYQHLAIGIVSPLKYLTIVFSAVIGYLVSSEISDLHSLAGIAIIATSCLYTPQRELIVKSGSNA